MNGSFIDTKDYPQQLSMRSSGRQGKRFGLKEAAETSNMLASPAHTNTAWMNSPQGGDPSTVALTQGWVGTPSNWAQPGAKRSSSSPPGGNSREGSARGAAQGGLPGRPEPKQMASVVRDVS